MSKRIIRVFPRRTAATPNDALARIGTPEFWDEADEVHVSVSFSWDRNRAEWLAHQWETVAPVKLGGPAMGIRGETFEPGMYIKHGYTITSRGCPNRCWFCHVWRRDGNVRTLPIRDGWNLLDDNLLACPPDHIRAVFAMLSRQSRRAEFTGGLEAARLEDWHVDALRKLKPKQVFFAYDTPDDLAPLRDAGSRLLGAGFTAASHVLRCYVLCGYPKDTPSMAANRMEQALCAGFTPLAMLYRDAKGHASKDWRSFQRTWARPAIIYGRKERSCST